MGEKKAYTHKDRKKNPSIRKILQIISNIKGYIQYMGAAMSMKRRSNAQKKDSY